MAALFLFVASIMASSSIAATPTQSFEDNFNIMWSENHFTTSEDGQIWNLSLDNDTGTFKYTLLPGKSDLRSMYHVFKNHNETYVFTNF